MRELIFITFSLLLWGRVCAQHRPPWDNYYGSYMIETRQKLQQYLNHYHYDGVFSQTDSTIELTTNYSLAPWTIYSTFYFDKLGKCYAYTNRRCDSGGAINLQRTLDNKFYKWKKIATNKYISKFSDGELLEIIESGTCTVYRRTELHLSKREYKQLINTKYRDPASRKR